MKLFAVIFVAALLASCGARQQLQPVPGQKPPPKSAMVATPPTTAQMLEIPPLAKPNRVDEPLRRSEVREDDRFDLPPPE